MRHDESGEYDNEDAWVLGFFFIFLYLFGAAVVAFGWMVVLVAVVAVVAVAVTVPLGIDAYLRSETRRYRQAQREIKHLTKETKRRMRKLRP
jgi:hypothetical protein